MEIVEKLAYLLAAVLFLVGLKLMARPGTAAKGNRISAIAMVLAVGATLMHTAILTLPEIMGGLVTGSLIGVLWARSVKETEMPELAILFNGFSGLAALLVGLSDYWSRQMERNMLPVWVALLGCGLAILVGGIAFSGSMIAWAKVSGRMNGNRPGLPVLNFILLLISLALCGLLVPYPEYYSAALTLVVLSLVLGVSTVLPIGQNGMPVMISLLNSYSGIAACCVGFVVQSEVLIIAGALVGASGVQRTMVLCRETGPGLFCVIVGRFRRAALSREIADLAEPIEEVKAEEAA